MTASRCLATISLGERGGGVAAASRLMWRAMQERWPATARLVTLLEGQGGGDDLSSSTTQRLQFGAKLAKAQILRECEWVFYAHIGVAQVQGYLPVSTMQRPYGVFLHGIEIWGTLSAVQRRVLEGAALLIANSSYTAERARQTHAFLGPISICPLALPPPGEDVDGQPVPRGAQDFGPHMVLLVGRMAAAERYKGHDQLIDAWASVLREIPDAQLIFAGSGDDQERLQHRVASLGLSTSVRFLGFLPAAELAALYARAAVFAMPSRNEGFGLVYLEAMSHGLPCVATRDDAARDVILDGQTGFLVGQDDIPGLADRLVRLLSDSGLRRLMGERGQTRAKETFSYGRFSNQFTMLLETHLHRQDTVVPSATGAR